MAFVASPTTQKPVAVLASKADIPGERFSDADLLANLGLTASETVKVFAGVSGATGAGINDAIDWLCDAM